jgi:CDP-diacylglycerol--serine O-phosphatidyltransferase
MALSGGTGKVKYFEGTPIPSSVIIVAILGVAFAQQAIDSALWLGAYRLGPATLHPLVLLYLINGMAMISATLRIPKP